MDTITIRPRSGPLWLLAYALLGILAAACGARSSGNATPTLISQPTPDRTVDAVVRGLVTLPPLGTALPGTPGTAAPTPLGGSPSQVAAPVVATPHLAPVAASPTHSPIVTAAVAPRLASPTLAPTRAPATLAPTAAPPVRAPTAAPAVAPAPTRAVAPTDAPAPTRAVAPAVAPTAPRPAPTAVRPAPTAPRPAAPAAPLPTFGRSAAPS